ncbi:MAG TPA: MFS transporter, partial [Candidatus Kapabacteria bacterium]|nr:MFS transporter [Candidatus Kapabacteria bacterium]
MQDGEGNSRVVVSKRSVVREIGRYTNGKIESVKDMSGKTFRSLRHRNYRLFFSGQLVSLCGTWMQNVAQSWLVWELSHSALWLGIIGFMTFLPQLLFSLFGGTVADRFPKRGLIIVTQTVSMVLAFVLAALVWTNVVTVWWVAALAFMLGTVNSFDMPARQAFVVEMVGKEDMTNAIGLNSAIFNSARLIGPALGGIVIGLVGTAWCFFLNGVSFIAVIIGLYAMQLPPSRIVHMGKSVWKSAKDGMIFIRREPTVRSIMVLVSAVTVFGWSYSVLLPLFADEVLHVGAVGLGNLYSANGVGALLSALFVAAVGDKIKTRKMVFTGISIFLIGVTCFALSHWFWISMVSLTCIGMGLISFFATANSTLQKLS